MGAQDALAAARRALVAAEAAVARNVAALADAQAALADLEASGASLVQRRPVIREIRRLTTARAQLDAGVATARAEVQRLRDLAAGATGPEQLIAALDGQVPVALLPVRLETRFSADRQTLRIRVFPDQIHKDDHEPELTDAEFAAGQEYWRARWAAGADAPQARAAWQRIAAGSRAPRARYVVEVTTPQNVAALGQGEPRFPDVARKPAPWTRAAQAVLLPEQWVALGYRAGNEVLRAWGATIPERVAMGPEPEIETGPEPAEGELPIDDGIRWLVDYDAALKMGMAITVTDAEVVGGLGRGLDALVVVGVDWSLDPAAGAIALGDRLAAAAGSDGLSLLAAGTPTNNTATDSAAAADVARLDPFDAPPPPVPDAAGAKAERALGLGPGSALAAAPGADAGDDLGARHMANALWPTTWGYFLDQLMRPLVSDAASDAAREHFCDHVRGRGPLPALRVGDQPYGLLPVVAPDAWAADDPVEGQIGAQLRSMRGLWSDAAASVPALGDSDAPDRDLVTVLRMSPRSASYRVRRATGPAVLAAGKGLEALAPFQELSAKTFLSLANIEGRPRLVDLVLDTGPKLLPVPLTSDALSESGRLDPNYIAQIATAMGRKGGLLDPLALRPPPRSLLEALVLQSAQIEISDAAAGAIVIHELAQGTLQARPAQVQVRDRELHGIDPAALVLTAPGQRRSLLDAVGGPSEVAQLKVPEISGTDTLADRFATTKIDDLRSQPSTKRLGEFRASIEYLATLPSAELDRLAAETLDCCSHRIDAWLTSLATRRLDTVRETVAGTYVGGFGWLEDVHPRADPASFGYVHAPSVAQASSAAILRSGHLGRRGDAAEALALDLSSQRVARALDLLDGMRQGQPIGALLGYRFERGLRDRRIALAGYILAFRQAAPLQTAVDGFADNRPVEAIAARDVVDGLKLLDLRRTNEGALLERAGVAATDRDDVRAELAALDDLLDAVADLLLAEGVHQMVAGNDERAGAALDALDRQTALPDLRVARTPRTGSSASHRLLLALHDGAAPAGWASDPRAAAEPRLNAWAARVLGDPGAARLHAAVRDAAGGELERVQATLAELSLSPLSTVMAAGAAGGSERATELESRLGLALAAKVTAQDAATLELLPDPPAGAPAEAIGLAELLAFASELLDLAGACRPASAADLVLDSELRDPAPVDPGYDVAELKRRADTALSTLTAAVNGLPAAGSNATAQTLARRLLAAADAGVPGAVPAGEDREALLAQAQLIRAAGDATGATVQAAEAAFDRGAATPAQRVEHDLARLRSIFGESFPAAALFTAANAGALGASLADATALLGGDPLVPAAWLAQHALVRPSAARLSTVLSGAEALGRDIGADQLEVAQLPHAPGERWIALPGERPAGALGLVVHTPGGLRPAEPVAAWVVDAWQDVVPNATETTGVSFHYDAPGARAPQTLLLAVPPSAVTSNWSLEMLAASVREALALAGMRGVQIDQLAAVPRFLPATYLGFNLEGKTPSIDFGPLFTQAIERDNAAFAAEGP